MKHNITAKYGGIELRPIDLNDIEQLRQWRNDEENTRFLRRIGHINSKQQEEWFENYLSNETELFFAIVDTANLKRMVGSVSIYNINGRIAEVGRILIGDTKAHGRGIGRISFVMAILIAFKLLNIDRIVASVHQDNTAAYINDMRIGFIVTGHHEAIVGGVEDEIEIDLERLLEMNDFISEVDISSAGRLAK